MLECVIGLSKELIYSFKYNTMKIKYGDNIDLCYQDV